MRMGNLSMKLAALLLALLGGTASMHAGWKTVGKKSLDGFVYVLTYNDESGLRVANSVTLPSATTVIPENAFSGCESMESITLPEGVTKQDARRKHPAYRRWQDTESRGKVSHTKTTR